MYKQVSNVNKIQLAGQSKADKILIKPMEVQSNVQCLSTRVRNPQEVYVLKPSEVYSNVQNLKVLEKSSKQETIDLTEVQSNEHLILGTYDIEQTEDTLFEIY